MKCPDSQRIKTPGQYSIASVFQEEGRLQTPGSRKATIGCYSLSPVKVETSYHANKRGETEKPYE
jgi:hypothetical protein